MFEVLGQTYLIILRHHSIKLRWEYNILLLSIPGQGIQNSRLRDWGYAMNATGWIGTRRLFWIIIPDPDAAPFPYVITFVILIVPGVHSAQNHKLSRILYDTRPYHSRKLNALALPSYRSMELQLLHGNRAQVQIYLPPSWREELRDAAFPVLVEVWVKGLLENKKIIFKQNLKTNIEY